MVRLIFGLVLAGWLVGGHAGAARVGDFALLDHEGRFHQLSYYGDHQAVVLMTHGNDVADVQAGVGTLQALADQNTARAAFFLLNPVAADTRQSIAADAVEHGYPFPVLVDEAQLVAESLGLTRLAEVIVIDAKRQTLVYRGSLPADAEAVREVLVALENGAEPAASTGTLAGKPIGFPAREQDAQNPVSYSRDIAPMLADNCVSCHQAGGIGPWAMTDYNMVRGWAPMMREVVMTRRMPPGQIDPHVGKPIADVAGLTPREAQRLIHWIDAGAPADEAADPLASLDIKPSRFTLGEPDLVFQVPPQTIPATGIIDYRYVPVELDLEEDIWIRAMEFVPGDRQVLHHVIAYVASPADKSVRGRSTGAGQGENLAGFAPGRQPDAFRDNSGRLVRKGSNLLLQMHYTTSGRETVDATEVGIYLHDKPPRYVMSGGVAGERRFLIPPQVKEHKLQGVQLVERDAYLYQMTPHMHFRGKYMRYTAQYPDGTSELLLSVPKYDFNWQFSYALEEPLFLPAGTRIVADGAMDNSDRNPGNPAPDKPVHFGLQTRHEMFFGFTTLRYVGDTPENLVTKTQEEPPEMARR